MNRKGYTLVELLAVIVIIGLIIGIAVISYSSYQQSTAERVFETYMDSMHEATIMYFLEHTDEMPTSTNTSKKILLQNLPIDKFNNPFKQGDYCVNDNSYVTATWQDSTNNKGMSGIKYSVCLYCNQYQKCKDYTN